MTLKGKYINGHIEIIDQVQIKENTEVEIHILDDNKVEPMKITFEKPEDEREKERLRKIKEEMEKTSKMVKENMGGKNRNRVITNEEIDANSF